MATYSRVVGLGLDVGVGDTGGVDEDVRGAVGRDASVDGGVDGGTVTDVDLEEGNGETGLLVKLGGSFVAELLVDVEDDEGLRTGLGAGPGHVVSETASTTVRGAVSWQIYSF